MFTQQQARAVHRAHAGSASTNPRYQPRNERGNILAPNGKVKPGDGTLARDERAHLLGNKPRPKVTRHREWPWTPQQQ